MCPNSCPLNSDLYFKVYCKTEEALTSFEEDWLDFYDFICDHEKLVVIVFAVITTAVFFTQRRKVSHANVMFHFIALSSGHCP